MPIIVPGQVQRNSFVGKLQRDKATGKIRRAKDSSQLICCCKGTCPCSGGGSLPDTISATFSGVTIPSGCLVYADFSPIDAPIFPLFSYSYELVSVPINQKFCLTRVPNTCVWTAQVPCTMKLWQGQAVAGLPGDRLLCDCGSGGSNSLLCGGPYVFSTLQIVMSVTDFGSGPEGNIYAAIFNPSPAPPVFFGDLIIFGNYFANIGAGGFFTPPCNGTVTANNAWTWYRTIYIVGGSLFITDPGGACTVGVDVPCPASNGNPFGGSVLIDTTGAPCP